MFPYSITASRSAAPGPADLHAKLDWLVCREVYIPEKTELDLSRTVANQGSGVTAQDQLQLIRRFEALLPKPAPASFKPVFQAAGAGFRLAVTTGQRETSVAFFPADQDLVDNPSPQTVTPTDKGFVIDLKKDENLTAPPDQLRGVLELSGGRVFEIAATPGVVAGVPLAAIASVASVPAAAPGKSASAPASLPSTSPRAPAAPPPGLLQSAAFAFLGGLLLNLMPCVFPVLFLKGLALVNRAMKSGTAARAWVGLCRGDSGLVLGAGGGAAGAARGGSDAGLGLSVSVAGLSGADGGAALLPGTLAGGAIRDWTDAD